MKPKSADLVTVSGDSSVLLLCLVRFFMNHSSEKLEEKIRSGTITVCVKRVKINFHETYI